ncbi:aminodeoxychorismate lyase [Cognatilysobacter terrigena]|uniref:aminodeoxychorismate lyase n=1 Tax=Cognatilysobacter terrigena TaxID=2488749 RepID=UPI001414FFA5|nr:aminodeoxychorismate lyase [Lysobacter terrigena]
MRLFEGSTRVDSIAPMNRGLAYGDGLFETMRAHRGDVPWWDRHWSRLEQGCDALRIATPDQRQAREQLRELLDGRDAVAKLVVTRGAGGRGYAPSNAPPFWMLSLHQIPTSPERIALRWCETRMSIQPALAGHKHCNRLEQVLARGEWRDGEPPDDGLMLDTDGYVVSAVAGNAFLLNGDAWSTPAVDRCGVRGVCRDWARDALGAHETRVAPADVESADALFVCNAVRGILEVARLGDRMWSPHPQVARLRERLATEHPAFALTPESP